MWSPFDFASTCFLFRSFSRVSFRGNFVLHFALGSSLCSCLRFWSSMSFCLFLWSFLCLCPSVWSSCFLCLHMGPPGNSSIFDWSNLFICSSGVYLMAVMASWAFTSFTVGAEDGTIFCTQTETYFSRSLLVLTSCQLLFF